MPMLRPLFIAAVSMMPGQARAQGRPLGIDELLFLRTPIAEREVLELRGGLAGQQARNHPENSSREELAPEGHIFYFNDKLFAPEWSGLFLLGTDSFYEASVLDDALWDWADIRLEIYSTVRPLFFREGTFAATRSGQLRSTYEGSRVGGRLGFESRVAERSTIGITFGFDYNRFSDGSAESGSAIEPDDYSSGTLRLFAEHQTAEPDEVSGRPKSRFLVSMFAEGETNGSSGTFGGATSQLSIPSTLARGRARVEGFRSLGSSVGIVGDVEGAVHSRRDYVQIQDARHPEGHVWIDASVGVRWELAKQLTVDTRARQELVWFGDSADASDSFRQFSGGSVDVYWKVSRTVSWVLGYSYLDTPYRPPVSLTDDSYGEHVFFVGMTMRLTDMPRSGTPVN